MMLRMKRLSFIFLAPLFTAALLWSQTLPATAPESVGMSSERLGRWEGIVRNYVQEGKISGAVTIVLREGKQVHLSAIGLRDVEAGAPMQADTIFRIASMSKAVTSVAAMMLLEEGKLLLSDPVWKFIPAFKKTQVAIADGEGTGKGYKKVPAKRAITIRDLLTHTSGYSYGSGVSKDEYKNAGFASWYFADKAEPVGTWIEKLAQLPADAHPGERYIYGYNTDILGAVVEKASGMTLAEFFAKRIFKPLKMVDTHFFLPSEKSNRLAAVYSADSASGRIKRAGDPYMGQGDYVKGPRACYAGGAGLLSTARDYARFLQMLLNGGELEGVRLLSPTTVAIMSSNHVGALYQEGRFGFGLGFEIVEHIGRAGRAATEGEYGWGGAYFTKYYVAPKEKLVTVFMCNLLPSGGLDLQEKWRTSVYQSVIAPAK